MNKKILFYPDGHGFGHAVRQIEIIKKIFEYNLNTGSNHRVIVRTSAPEWLFKMSLELYFNELCDGLYKKVSEWFSYYYVVNGVGTIQKDSLNLDIDKTYEAARDFYDIIESRAAVEAEFILTKKIDIVVGDIPPLAFAAAKKAGVASIGITNFSWDYIYEEFIPDNPGFINIIDKIKKAYAGCRRLLSLPFSCPLPAFKNISSIAMIARRPYLKKDAVFKALSFKNEDFEGKMAVMISAGGFDTSGIKYRNLALLSSRYIFLTTTPPVSGEKYPDNVKFIDTAVCEVSFENLFTIFDIIATKPGYGVAGDIIGSGSLCLFTDRGRFREYEFLVNFLKKYTVSSVYISRDEFLNCDYESKINELTALKKKPAPLNLNGARDCASMIIAL